MSDRWIIRRGAKRSGFRYIGLDGRPITSARERARIDALRVPPGWSDVHIAPSARSAIQAWGIDAKGRKQYRYHARAVERAEQRKHYRVRRLARDLPKIRDRMRHDFARADLSRRQVAAAVLHMISEGFFRVGGERYAKENGTFGLTTLRKSHVRVDGDCLYFLYKGKRSIEQRQVLVDRTLAAFARELARAPGKRLFRYRQRHVWRDLTARDVNDYVREVTGRRYTAKDFRTWGGTLRVATVLAELGRGRSESDRKRNALSAIRMVAAELGNTPAICRKSYVHPIVLARYVDAGETMILTPARRAHRRRSSVAHYPEERALIRFLDTHVPERRRRLRDEDVVEHRESGIRNGGSRTRKRPGAR
jgi:DNA topoisomerase-1